MRTILFVIIIITCNTISFGQSFQWINSIAGIDNQLPTGNRIAVNSNGETFAIGTFKTQTIIGSDTLTSTGIQSTYFAKYNTLGIPLWARKVTGTVRVHGNSIAIDKQNNVYITGAFEGSATFQSTTLTSTGTGAMQDLYVAKYDSTGTLIWVNNYSGSSSISPLSVKTDTLSNIYLTGTFAGARVIGSGTLTSIGIYDMFLVKLNTMGNVMWAKNFGGNSKVNPYDITLDGSLNIYSIGHFGDAYNGPSPQNVVFGSTTLSTPQSKASELFLAKFDNSGNAIFAKKMGGNYQNDRGFGINYDGANNIYLTGGFEGQAFFGNDTVSTNPPVAGKYNAFVAKYDLTGNCIWVTQPDTNLSFQGFDIIINNQNNIYVAGSAGKNSLMKFDNSGANIWINEIGNSSGQGMSISSDQFGAIYMTGTFSGSMETNIDTLVTTNIFDNFVGKIDTTFVGILENLSPFENIELEIFPNPTKDYLNIVISSWKQKDYKLKIINLYGQELQSYKIFASNAVLDLSQLQAGIYFVLITDEKKQIAKKIVKH